jgi:hypothetical protein
VAAADGWRDVTTLLTCYQHADEATMLKVMASPTKTREPSSGQRSGETVAETVAAGAETKRPDQPKWNRTFELPLLGSNQDSPDPEWVQ